jgi:4-hydroxy-2-oxoheptanedioate aldolase
MASFLKRDLAASRRFKEKLRKKEIATLIGARISSPALVEEIGHNGFDAALLEAEHGSINRERVEDMSRAAAIAGTAALIRPEGSVPHLVTGYLGCGVDGFMLPLIRSVAQAQELVDTFRFSAPRDFSERVLIFMIEHVDAIDNLDALLAIEGVDAFLVAPSDLAISMRESFDPLSPRVSATIERTVGRIVDAGKTCGARVDVEDMDAFVEKGVSLIYYHAHLLLALGAKDFHSRIESAKRGLR